MMPYQHPIEEKKTVSETNKYLLIGFAAYFFAGFVCGLIAASCLLG